MLTEIFFLKQNSVLQRFIHTVKIIHKTPTRLGNLEEIVLEFQVRSLIPHMERITALAIRSRIFSSLYGRNGRGVKFLPSGLDRTDLILTSTLLGSLFTYRQFIKSSVNITRRPGRFVLISKKLNECVFAFFSELHSWGCSHFVVVKWFIGRTGPGKI